MRFLVSAFFYCLAILLISNAMPTIAGPREGDWQGAVAYIKESVGKNFGLQFDKSSAIDQSQLVDSANILEALQNREVDYYSYLVGESRFTTIFSYKVAIDGTLTAAGLLGVLNAVEQAADAATAFGTRDPFLRGYPNFTIEIQKVTIPNAHDMKCDLDAKDEDGKKWKKQLNTAAENLCRNMRDDFEVTLQTFEKSSIREYDYTILTTTIEGTACPEFMAPHVSTVESEYNTESKLATRLYHTSGPTKPEETVPAWHIQAKAQSTITDNPRQTSLATIITALSELESQIIGEELKLELEVVISLKLVGPTGTK